MVLGGRYKFFAYFRFRPRLWKYLKCYDNENVPTDSIYKLQIQNYLKKLEYTIKKDHRRISLYGHILERVVKKK